MGKKLTKEEIYDRILEKYKDHENIDCSKVEVINMSTPVVLICKLHGEFAKRPQDILYKCKNCPTCSKISKSKKLSEIGKTKTGSKNNFYGRHHTKETFEKQKRNNLKKYGVEWPQQSEEIKEKIRCTVKSEECQNKIQKTNRERYGLDYTVQMEKCRQRTWDNETAQKRVNTLKKHGLNSKLENYFEDKLIQLNIDYYIQYKSEDYPWHCDFYLLDKDLYVEINGYWTHGNHPFNKNDQEDINILTKWKKLSKVQPHYTIAVYVWSDLDIQKRKTAKQNNINFIELWDKDDIDKFFELYNKEENI